MKKSEVVSVGHEPNSAWPLDESQRISSTQLTISGLAVVAVGAAAAVGMIDFPLVDLVVLLGVAVVLPLALPGRWLWSVAAIGVLISLLQPIGWSAAVFVLPWITIAVAAALSNFRAPSAGLRDLRRLAAVAAAGYALVAAVAFASSRLGLALFGINEPIVELTAVHYTYAGTAALVLGARLLGTTTGSRRGVAQAATVLTAVAPIIVATGFVIHRALPQVGGAVLMTVGVWLTATLELRAAFDRRGHLMSRLLLGISGAAIWIPMVLAMAWAAGQHWDVPALSIAAMERTHGVANALAFVLCGLLSWRFRRRTEPRRDPADEAALVA